MRKLFSLLLVFVMLFSIFACNDAPPAPNDGDTTGGQEENAPTSHKANPVTDFEYSIREDQNSIAILKYVGTSKSIVFPEKIDGLPVKVIGGDLLDSGELRPLIDSVVIPDTVEIIVDYAFAYCTNLVSVDFGENVAYIGESAFEECTALKKIILPSKLETIGAGAFYKCSSATEIFVPKTVKEWGFDTAKGTFGNCTSLTTLSFEDGLEQIGYWSTFMGAELLKRVEIPASVKKIATLAFNCCPSLTEVVFKGDVPQATQGNVKNMFGYEGDHDNLVLCYDPTTEGWDTVVWREIHQLQPLS